MRGFALLGILLVNIESFLYGAAESARIPRARCRIGCKIALFSLSLPSFVDKFMPLFGMLFGAGFSVLSMTSSSHASPIPAADLPAPAGIPVHIRHAAWISLYFGDITQVYAVAGLVLLRYAESDVAGLGACHEILVVSRRRVGLALFIWIGTVTTLSPDTAPIVERQLSILHRRHVPRAVAFPHRCFWRGRLSANLLGLPLVIALMLTGTAGPSVPAGCGSHAHRLAPAPAESG